MSYFNENFLILRQRKRLSKVELAKIFEVNQHTVHRWQTNSSPSLEYLIKISEFFGVTIDELVSRSLTKNDNEFFESTSKDKDGLKKEQLLNLPTLDIFISHSSHDWQIVKGLIELIRSALNISAKKIRCTSVEGYKLSGGVNTDEELRREVEDNKLFIGVLSEASIKSVYTLFEIGARWGSQKPFKLLYFEKNFASKLQAPLKNYHSLDIGNRSGIYQLIDEISNVLNIPSESAAVYVNFIDSLLKSVHSP